jgi:hypothetical protein
MKNIYILVFFAGAQLQGAASSESLGAKFTRLAHALTSSNEEQKRAAVNEIYNTPRLLSTIEIKATQTPQTSSPSDKQLHDAAVKIKAHLPATGQTTEKESLASKISRHASIVKHSLEGDFDQMEQEIRENPGYRAILKNAAAGDSKWKRSQDDAKEIISYLKYQREFAAEFR